MAPPFCNRRLLVRAARASGRHEAPPVGAAVGGRRASGRRGEEGGRGHGGGHRPGHHLLLVRGERAGGEGREAVGPVGPWRVLGLGWGGGAAAAGLVGPQEAPCLRAGGGGKRAVEPGKTGKEGGVGGGAGPSAA